MKKAPIPVNEEKRLLSLYKLRLLDTNPEERFDRITKIATKIFKVPISTLTLVDRGREWFKSCQGLSKREGDRAISFCGHALVAKKDILVILDATQDLRFRDNPMVVGDPHIRFYAGVPILSADGERVGVFCIKDNKPRAGFSNEDIEILKGLASWSEVEVNSRNLSLALSSRRKVEDELREKVRELEKSRDVIKKDRALDEAILEGIGEGLVVIDKSSRVLMFNDRFLNLLGLKRKEVVGKVYGSFWVLEDKEGGKLSHGRNPIEIALSGEIVNVAKYDCIRKDGTKFPIFVTASPVLVNNHIIGAVGILRDITKEDEIDRAKTEFVSLASHQLRTPLGVVKWYLEAIKDDSFWKKIPESIRNYFNQVYESNERVIKLVRDFLSVSRIDQGRVQNNPEKVDLVKLMEKIAGEMSIIALKKKIEFKLKLPKSKMPDVFIDPLRFSEAVENLISNALEYTPSSGVVEVSLERPEEKMFLVSIKDTGIGISLKDQKNLFTKFFRGEKRASFNTQGSGLGLYVVKSYVEGWGGKVSFVSHAGKGSRFNLTIPFETRKGVNKR